MQGRKRLPLSGTAGCQQAFDDLKTLCTMAPILAYADFTKTFKLILMLVALVWELSSTKLERVALKQ